MAATTTTSSAAAAVVFGCTAETGILISSLSRETTRDKAEATNHQGDVVAVTHFKPMATISIEGVVNGTTGVAAAAPGVALALNSAVSGNGITGGTILVDTVSREQTSEEFATISVEATQYPSI